MNDNELHHVYCPICGQGWGSLYETGAVVVCRDHVPLAFALGFDAESMNIAGTAGLQGPGDSPRVMELRTAPDYDPGKYPGPKHVEAGVTRETEWRKVFCGICNDSLGHLRSSANAPTPFVACGPTCVDRYVDAGRADPHGAHRAFGTISRQADY